MAAGGGDDVTVGLVGSGSRLTPADAMLSCHQSAGAVSVVGRDRLRDTRSFVARSRSHRRAVLHQTDRTRLWSGVTPRPLPSPSETEICGPEIATGCRVGRVLRVRPQPPSVPAREETVDADKFWKVVKQAPEVGPIGARRCNKPQLGADQGKGASGPTSTAHLVSFEEPVSLEFGVFGPHGPLIDFWWAPCTWAVAMLSLISILTIVMAAADSPCHHAMVQYCNSTAGKGAPCVVCEHAHRPQLTAVLSCPHCLVRQKAEPF